MSARGAGSRIVCHLNRRSAHNSLLQLRDRRGALSTAAGNGKTTMVFLSARKPRGNDARLRDQGHAHQLAPRAGPAAHPHRTRRLRHRAGAFAFKPFGFRGLRFELAHMRVRQANALLETPNALGHKTSRAWSATPTRSGTPRTRQGP